MTMTEPGAAVDAVEMDYVVAYEALRPKFSALAEVDCETVNADIPSASLTAMWAAKRLRALRPAIQEHTPTFPLIYLDELEQRAQAAAHAHANFTLASNPRVPISELDEKLNRTRQLFIDDINTLANRGLIDNSKLVDLKSPNGYKNLAFGVLALAAHLRNNWETIKNRTGVTLDEIEEAQGLAQRFITALAVHERGPGEVGPTTLIRKQTFTLLVKGYEQIRRVVTYLRWNERDLESWAPTLYLVRKKGGSSNEVETPETAPVSPVSPAAPGLPVAAPAAGADTAGLPGSKPFGGG